MSAGGRMPQPLRTGTRSAAPAALRGVVAPLVLIALMACATPGATPVDPPLRDGRTAARVPDAADHAAADLAAAALAGDPRAAADASARIAAFDTAREEGPTGLAPVAAELWSAAQATDRAAWREQAAALLERDDLDPALRARIERALEDDPLERADDDIRAARRNSFARAFNAVVQPLGQSLLSISLAPYRLGRSLVHYGVHLYRRDPLPLERRQALAHWKEFLARYPDAPQSEEVSRKVEDAEARWHQTMRRRALAGAEAALDADRPREALLLSERALRHSPEYEKAEEVRSEAARRLLSLRADQARSTRFALPEGGAVLGDATREEALALLSGAELPEPTDEDPDASALHFARASRLARQGREREAHALLEEVASADADRDAMARHAQAALGDPVRNPWDTFERARWRDRRKRALWLLVGPLADSEAPDDPDEALITLVELPRMAQAVITLPLRLLNLPWASPLRSSKVTAVQARRYLRLHPHGVHADEARDWLQRYEQRRDNPLAALEIAEQRDPDGDHADLREQAASQMLRVAQREERPDLRRAMLKGVTRRFPETEAGDVAGRLVRTEVEEWTPHRVVLSRGFLLENPDVAGVEGLDLDPALLDEDGRNGELHPDGLALLGGRVVEIAYLDVSGDEDDPPVLRHQELSRERMARLVARLEETSFRNALLDEQNALRPDAQRDHLFERARLGLTDEPDTRPTASSHFAYRGMRERYGMVQRREPMLPFDLVVQGSLTDLSLGAFPRMRSADEPKDALLYE